MAVNWTMLVNKLTYQTFIILTVQSAVPNMLGAFIGSSCYLCADVKIWITTFYYTLSF